jgi:hypothetical protein
VTQISAPKSNLQEKQRKENVEKHYLKLQTHFINCCEFKIGPGGAKSDVYKNETCRRCRLYEIERNSIFNVKNTYFLFIHIIRLLKGSGEATIEFMKRTE